MLAPWCKAVRKAGQVTTLRERLAQMHAEATYGTPYGKVDARVAAALVAVADESQKMVLSAETVFNMQPALIAKTQAQADAWGRAYAALHDLRASLDALAAALGVSR